MRETINQRVEVLASFKNGPRGSIVVVPIAMNWNGRQYRLDRFGLYHPERRGSVLWHIFSFQSDNIAFRLELNPETLEWILVEAYYGT